MVGWGGYALYHSDMVQRKYFYVYPYRQTVETYAAKYDVDSDLVAAVIKNESKFKTLVHSHRGAIGLMQLMPDTAEWIAKRIDDPDYSDARLHDPTVNIQYGTWYLADLQEEFHGNDILALAAYNAGRGNVQDWIAQYGWTQDFCDVDAIPYQETRVYVKKVLHDQQRYEQLYPKD